MKTLKLLFSVLIVCFCFADKLNAQSGGKVFDNLVVKSSILNEDVNYSIYLPPDYETSERSYPVLYLLHGYSDDHTGWVQFGQVKAIADKAIDEGKAAPMIIVMPDAGKTWYVNDYKGEVRYEDFFITELIPAIEAKYRCRTKKEFRAVAGLSMGGHGSLIYALKHPDMFTACCPLSAAVHTSDELMAMDGNNANYRFANLYGSGTGTKRLTDHWKKNNTLEIIKNIPDDKKRTVRLYIDCGDDDFLYKGNAALHVALRDANIPHEFRIRDGGHTWVYWRESLPSVLEFISKSFHR